MAHHHAHGAKVERPGAGDVVEGRLEDARREGDLVARGGVVGVHYGRGHVPLALVGRLVQLADVLVEDEAVGVDGVVEVLLLLYD